MSGSVEAACGLGLADGIVDLVETGTTMKVSLQHGGSPPSDEYSSGCGPRGCCGCGSDGSSLDFFKDICTP